MLLSDADFISLDKFEFDVAYSITQAMTQACECLSKACMQPIVWHIAPL